MRKISLSGIKPTGTPHLGNYLAMIRPALDLVKEYRALYFIADYHGLTTVRNGNDMEAMSYDVAATWLALGMDPEKVIFFRQSDIPEIFECTWILGCFTAKGLLNRAHAYKAAVDDNVAEGRDPDAGVNIGLYTYPVLMAADILLYGSHVVPVGQDQKQHVEIAADIAQSFNYTYGDILTIPEALIKSEVAVVPGTDGRKMSKSYDNVLPIFAPAKQLRKRVMGIVTDSRLPEQPKDPETDNLYLIYRLIATLEETEAMRQRYLAGGFGYGEVKQAIYEALERTFGEARAKYDQFSGDKAYLEKMLMEGAEKARAIGGPILDKMRRAVGMRRGL